MPFPENTFVNRKINKHVLIQALLYAAVLANTLLHIKLTPACLHVFPTSRSSSALCLSILRWQPSQYLTFVVWGCITHGADFVKLNKASVLVRVVGFWGS